jgi:hypothetical protein
MVPHPLAALDEPEIPDQANLTAAHSSQPAIPKTPHDVSMHCAAIPSILDEMFGSDSAAESLHDQWPHEPHRLNVPRIGAGRLTFAI